MDAESIVAAWHEVARCEATEKCRRPAVWRLNLHDCEQAFMCGQHMSGWKRRQNTVLNKGKCLKCHWCGRQFKHLDDACSVTRL